MEQVKGAVVVHEGKKHGVKDACAPAQQNSRLK